MTKLTRKQSRAQGQETWELDGTEVTSTAAELNIMDGVTSTTAELNKLDGVASTTTEIDERSLTATITDVSTADNAFVVCPWSGTVTNVYNVIDGTLATADNAMTTSIAGVAITGGGFTIAYSGSAAGDVDTSGAPTATNVVTAGQALSVSTPGSSTNTVKSVTTFKIQIT